MAQLTLEKLTERLTHGKPVPCLLLLGTDAFLAEFTRSRIVELLVDPTAREWGVSRFSADDGEFGQALGQARTVPMLTPLQVVILRQLEAVEKLPETERNAAIAELAEYLEGPSPFTCLVLEAPALDQRMKLAKLLAEKAIVILAELPDDPEERLRVAAGQAGDMARRAGASIDADAAEELADLCNGNLAAISSEIEKLATFRGAAGPIRRADVELLVVSEKKYSVWELADVLSSHQRGKAFVFLDNLLHEGEPAPALVGAMGWMFRKLLEAQELGAHVSGYQAAGRLGMRSDAAEKALQHARKISRQQIVDGIRALYEADSQLKSGSSNERAVMEFLVARLTSAPAAASAKTGG